MASLVANGDLTADIVACAEGVSGGEVGAGGTHCAEASAGYRRAPGLHIAPYSFRQPTPATATP